MAATAMMSEGTIKLSPQGGLGWSVVGLAQKEGMMVPRMFPSEVCAFHMPMISPRLQHRCVHAMIHTHTHMHTHTHTHAYIHACTYITVHTYTRTMKWV